MIKHLPASSNFIKAAYPDSKWPVDQMMLLSRIEYELAILIYRDTKDAKAKRNRPKQILPPAAQKIAEQENKNSQTIKGYAMPIDELNKMFNVKTE